MPSYEDLVAELNDLSDKTYAAFSAKLMPGESANVIGVKLPVLRKIAKRKNWDIKMLLAFPDDYFEVTFIKLAAAANLPFGEFVALSDACVSLISDWALCDGFSPACIRSHKSEYLPFIRAYMGVNLEFYQRFSLVTLLHFYVEEPYLYEIFAQIKRADCKFYYVHTAVAWLLAEVIIKHFNEGVAFLKSGVLPAKTHNKTIQKCTESFRLSEEQKIYLKKLKV